MIDPARLQYGSSSNEAGAARPPVPTDRRGEPLLKAWRLILQDGTTDDDFSPGQVGQQLITEVTEALRGCGAQRGQPPRPRSIAMPPSPRQPLHALDQSLATAVSDSRMKRSGTATPAPASAPLRSESTPPETRRAPRSEEAASSGGPPCPLALREGSGRGELDVRLARVVDLWPQLPRSMRAAILAMVEAEVAETP